MIFESARRRANVQHTGWGLFLQGRSLLSLGHAEEALELIRRGHEYVIKVPDFVSRVMCEGLLARAATEAGDLTEGLAVALSLTDVVARRPPFPLAQCLDGYASLADVYLLAWERAGEHVRAARRACRQLRWFASLFPMARPASLRATGRERWLSGDHAHGRKLLERALESSRRLEMKYEEALTRDVMARYAGPGGNDLASAAEAERLFRELGCRSGEASRREVLRRDAGPLQ